MKQLFIFTITLWYCFDLSGQVDSGYVNVKSGRLYYEVYGEGAPIVFINGGPGISSSAYRYVVDKFGSGFKVILFDQRGTGKSHLKNIRNTTVNLKLMVKDLEALRVHLGLDKWVVVGQSFGGTYALSYATAHADHITKMVLISTAGSDSETYHMLQKFGPLPHDRLTPAECALLDTIYTLSLTEDSHSPKLNRYQIATNSRYYISDWSNMDKQINWFVHQAEYNFRVKKLLYYSLNDNDILNKLSNVKTETLILYGLKDFIPFNVPNRVHGLLENSELKVFSDCGHSMWLDKEEELKEYIRTFLIE